MKQEDLQKVVPGFDDPVLGSQVIFRRALEALSMPGRVVEVPEVGVRPPIGHEAAAFLLLALLDSDCTLWLSASLRNSAAQVWLRFHTGCRFVDDPAKARFLWLARGDAWPSLSVMYSGSEEYPDESSTCVMEVASLHGKHAWQMSGPGIDGSKVLKADGLPADFDTQWQANHAAFPRGVDVFLATDRQLLGLPRTTRLDRVDTRGA